MRIAQLAPLNIRVPPYGSGAIPRVISLLTEELLKLGNDVTLFASGDSQTSGRLVSVADRAVGYDSGVDALALHIGMLSRIYRDFTHEFDIIHSHLGYLTLPFTRHLSLPTVITTHGPLDRPEYEKLFSEYPDAKYVTVSNDQRRSLPPSIWARTIYLGIDVENFQFSANQGNYLCFVGRMAPEKRPDVAIEVALRCGIGLKIAGIPLTAREKEYFENKVRPLLNQGQIEWLGDVDEMGKRQLIGGALALILPIDWPEPFGLVFAEALACGTPVITCPYGSVNELLLDGVTGFTGRTIDELEDAVRKVANISRRTCRAHAEQLFSAQRMAGEYMDLYNQLLVLQ